MRDILVQRNACVPFTLCRDAGFEGAKAGTKQFENPLLRDDPLLSDEEEEGDDGKEDGDAA